MVTLITVTWHITVILTYISLVAISFSYICRPSVFVLCRDVYSSPFYIFFQHNHLLKKNLFRAPCIFKFLCFFFLFFYSLDINALPESVHFFLPFFCLLISLMLFFFWRISFLWHNSTFPGLLSSPVLLEFYSRICCHFDVLKCFLCHFF